MPLLLVVLVCEPVVVLDVAPPEPPELVVGPGAYPSREMSEHPKPIPKMESTKKERPVS
ncbi:Hypothetical protein A7982_03279 [Minicystis rosea]|nr:Hypothetical protein A7982_03279 [Minicystis rosea]